MKILVVDNSKTMLKIFTNVLKGMGKTEVVQAQNCSYALEEFSRYNFDLIITERDSPVMDGLSFVENIRKIDKDITIIMATSYSRKSEVLKSKLSEVINDNIANELDDFINLEDY